MIAAPTTANVGEQFIVAVTTMGLYCDAAERTDVELMTDAAVIWPYDRYSTGGCILLQGLFPHEAALVFDSPGDKTIHIHGSFRSRYAGDLEISAITDTKLTVTVQ
jgi:hypothetical protein